jgi:hypothetical protein
MQLRAIEDSNPDFSREKEADRNGKYITINYNSAGRITTALQGFC